MGREYKHSVKGSLTRKLVLIIISSVIILYSIVITIQFIAADEQSSFTESEVRMLKIVSFEGQLQSRSGQISQKLQMFINDLKSLH